MAAENLTQILLEVQCPELQKRRAAELKLKTAEETNFVEFVIALADQLAGEDNPETARQLAGIVLKNSISGNEKKIDQAKRDKWLDLPTETTNRIKEVVLKCVQSPLASASAAACALVAKIGRLELPTKKWPQLMVTMGQWTTVSNVMWKRAGYTALAYLCEDILTLVEEAGQDLLQDDDRNDILTQATRGMTDADSSVRLFAARSLYYALMFAQRNMENVVQQQFIMQVIGDCLEHQDPLVSQAAWECVLQIATEYYEYLAPYMGTLGPLSWKTIKESGSTQVAISAMELWNAICDVELSIIDGEDPDRELKNFVSQAQTFLLPILLETMTKQESEESLQSGEWTLSMAAGTCIGLCAQVLKDDIIPPTLMFVNSNFSDSSWMKREAAVYAYGSIMEGPSSEQLQPLVQTSITIICNGLSDRSVAVRDTTAWAIGRIAQFHLRCIIGLLPTSQPNGGLMRLLLEKLSDEPRVAANICFAIYSIAENIRQYSEENPPLTRTPIDESFQLAATRLLEVARRPDAESCNLRNAACEALSMLVAVVEGPDVYATFDFLISQFGEWLDQSVRIPPSEAVSQIQGLVCSCLSVLIMRTRNSVSVVASRLAALLLQVIDQNTTDKGEPSTAAEDALMALNGLAAVPPGPDFSFEHYLPKISTILIVGLKNVDDASFCKVCIQMVGDLSRTLGASFANYIGPMLAECYKILQNTNAPIQLKPKVMAVIGDVAMAMGGEFQKHLPEFLELLKQASGTRVNDGPVENDEWILYIQELRSSVLAAYAGIIYGLQQPPEDQRIALLKSHVTHIIEFAALIAQDRFSTDENVAAAIGVTGDLVAAFKSELATYLVKSPHWEKMKIRADSSKDEAVKTQAAWVQELVTKLYGP